MGPVIFHVFLGVQVFENVAPRLPRSFSLYATVEENKTQSLRKTSQSSLNCVWLSLFLSSLLARESHHAGPARGIICKTREDKELTSAGSKMNTSKMAMKDLQVGF
jgi:hypothetical protein